ncbi:iron complex outermembrane recepter protein [Methylobacillus rhizosphaerae]|uniref:Iron complex outermembrane recepter protein n=1 Tax=Methylobacillus rhizosphaerae TaxID=551994 RepID=A0A239AUU9_9PROT|nr:TonB-dependent siderophore receptor [Methylobacillus rhizosphaerae]SNR99387.1 iron complex outermembrane recepter protein [Methylobacillus rhizosphaerae]
MQQTLIAAVWQPKLVCLVVSALFTVPATAADNDNSVLPEVAVVGAKGGDETSSYVAKNTKGATKTDTPVIETPQSISIVGRKELDDRNVQNLVDALGYTAGVRTELSGVDSRADTYMIRGFKSGMDSESGASNLFIDGLKVQAGGQWNRASFDTYGLERVEVLKGPASVMYGQVVPGGMINLVTKKPTANHVNEIRLQGGSFDQYRISADIGGSLADDDSVLFRLVGSFNDGNSQLDHTDLQRTYFAPSLLWKISENTSLTLLAQYQRDKGGSTFQFLPYYGTYAAGAGGRRMSNSNFLGEPYWNSYDREQSLVGWAFEHRFNDIWQFRQNLRYTNLETEYKGVVNRGTGLSYTAGVTQVPAVGIVGLRTFAYGASKSEGVAVDNQLQADFSTGALKHTVLVGLDAQRINWTGDRRTFNQASSMSIFNPVYGLSPTVSLSQLTTASDYDVDQKQTGIYVQEQLAWDKLRFSIGARYDYFDQVAFNATNNRRNGFNDHAFTWNTGAVYLFDSGFAPFVSYSTSFEPGALGIAILNDESIKPIKAKQYEAGVKYQPQGSNSLVTASVYELKQENRLAAAGSCPESIDGSCYTQVGEARIRGFELEGKAEVTDSLTLLGSYTYMDSEITKSATVTETEGRDLSLVPKHMASLWANYAFNGQLDGLSAGLGVRYVGGSYGMTRAAGPADNPYLHTDSYTTYDAAVRYNLKSFGYHGAEVAINASNLTDRTYVAACTALTACYYGMGRVVNATLKYNW